MAVREAFTHAGFEKLMRFYTPQGNKGLFILLALAIIA